MLRKKAWIVLMATCFMFGLSGMASGGIQYSKHDFSISSQDTGFGTNFGGTNLALANGYPADEICVFCHTPHGASSAGYLWNRTTSAASTYSMYTSSSMTSAINMGTGPTGLTLMCMSCHDGITSIAVGTLINAPYTELGRSQVILDPAGTSFSAIGELYQGPTGLPPTWGPNIGNMVTGDTNADLSDDHPVSFTWVPGITGIKDPAAWGAAPLKLFNNRMECSTCHDVHDNTNAPFLRMSNVNSNMCLSCHIK